MNEYSIYIKTKNAFLPTLDCNEFCFTNVKVARDTGYLSLYREDGTLEFKCPMDEVEKFARISC